jgi:hypothetical protein
MNTAQASVITSALPWPLTVSMHGPSSRVVTEHSPGRVQEAATAHPG